jgi:endonuclease-3 related protein
VEFLDAQHGGSLAAIFATPTPKLREELLAQKGIGPETADSILLYAGHHAIFVVDAYTRRVLERHDAISPNAKYDEIRSLVERALKRHQPRSDGSSPSVDPHRPAVHLPSPMSMATKPVLAQTYNEMHGLFVQLGKHYCAKQSPKCDICPLGSMLNHRIAARNQQSVTNMTRQQQGRQ